MRTILENNGSPSTKKAGGLFSVFESWTISLRFDPFDPNFDPLADFSRLYAIASNSENALGEKRRRDSLFRDLSQFIGSTRKNTSHQHFLKSR